MSYICNQTGEPCSIATEFGYCRSTACLKRLNEKLLPEYDHSDPVDIHDEISAGFSRIEKAIREESAKMAEIIRQAVKHETSYLYDSWGPYDKYKIPVVPGEIPLPCKNCSNHPSNGGTGICYCTLATPKIT